MNYENAGIMAKECLFLKLLKGVEKNHRKLIRTIRVLKILLHGKCVLVTISLRVSLLVMRVEDTLCRYEEQLQMC